MTEETPDELIHTLDTMAEALRGVKSAVGPITKETRNEVITRLPPLDTAKIDLVSAYTCNSLFWTYLVTQGINPQNHPIKQELERIQKYMNRLKEIEDRKLGKVPKLEKDVAKRIIRNATYDLDAKNAENSRKRKDDKEKKIKDNESKRKLSDRSKNNKSKRKR